MRESRRLREQKSRGACAESNSPLLLRACVGIYSSPHSFSGSHHLTVNGEGRGRWSQFAFTQFQKAICKTKGDPPLIAELKWDEGVGCCLGTSGRFFVYLSPIAQKSHHTLQRAKCPTTSNELSLSSTSHRHPQPPTSNARWDSFFLRVGQRSAFGFQCNFAPQPFGKYFHGQPECFPFFRHRRWPRVSELLLTCRLALQRFQKAQITFMIPNCNERIRYINS